MNRRAASSFGAISNEPATLQACRHEAIADADPSREPLSAIKVPTLVIRGVGATGRPVPPRLPSTLERLNRAAERIGYHRPSSQAPALTIGEHRWTAKYPFAGGVGLRDEILVTSSEWSKRSDTR